MKQLRGRSALVTGASRGIGLHIARALAREGVNLAIVARTTDAIEQLALELTQTGVRAVAISADLSDVSTLDALLERAETEVGPLDILINNAGIDAMRFFPEESDADTDHMLRLDLLSPMLLTRKALPRMLARGVGHVVNIASLAGKTATPFSVSYSTAKAGLIAFSLSLREELRGSGVSASVICPGFVSGEGMFANRSRGNSLRPSPLLGTSRPERVATAVLRALRQDTAEIIVNPGPVRMLLALHQFSPDSVGLMQKRVLGLNDLMHKLALADRNPQPTKSS